MRPSRYPNVTCSQVRLLRAAMPGIEMTVSADVSVATIDNISAHHGSPPAPRK